MWNNGGYRQLLLYMGNDLGTFNEGLIYIVVKYMIVI